MFRYALPVLHVGSSAAAEEFYCRRLGFRRVFAYRPDATTLDPCYMGIERDDVHLHVSSFSGDGTSGTAVYLVVDNVDAVHAELLARGVLIDTPPVDQSWGNREMYVKDTDGNSIRFIQESGKS